MAVEFEELEGSPVYRADIDGIGTEVRRLICRWEDRWDVANHLLSNPSPYSGLYPAEIAVEPYHDGRNYSRIVGTNPIAYEKALIVISYSTRVVGLSGSNLFGVREQLESDVQMMRLDSGSLRYPDGTPLAAGEQITLPMITVRWIKSFRTITPLSALNVTIVNHINQNPVISQKYGIVFAPGTLLCRSVDLDQYSVPWAAGLYYYRVECFYNPHGWGTWVDKDGNPKPLIDKRTDQLISPYPWAFFPL